MLLRFSLKHIETAFPYNIASIKFCVLFLVESMTMHSLEIPLRAHGAVFWQFHCLITSANKSTSAVPPCLHHFLPPKIRRIKDTVLGYRSTCFPVPYLVSTLTQSGSTPVAEPSIYEWRQVSRYFYFILNSFTINAHSLFFFLLR